MEAQDRIVASVQELLGQVQKLKIEKDALEGFNPAKATYLQCQIFRNFAIIEALLASCPRARKVIGKAVLLSKKELGAGVKDLKLMPIPKPVTTENLEEWRDGQWNKMLKEPFPFLLLPPEVRKIILGYLTSPSDKMNFRKAVPEDGHMMEWNLNSLRLELALPIVFAEKWKLGYDDTVKLCQASPELHRVVGNCFVKTLNGFHSEHLENEVGDSYQKLSKLRASDFLLNPLPATIEVDREESIQELLQILQQVGTNIWSFLLRVGEATSIQQTLDTVRDFLQLTPNLRKLEIEVVAGRQRTQDDNDGLELYDIRLPDLRWLQKLDVMTSNSAISSKLLTKYGSVVTSIELDCNTIFPTSPEDEYQFPYLINLYSSNKRFGVATDIVKRLEPFVGAPLKRITLTGGYYNNTAENFQSVLCALARFSDTLEEVSVELAYQNEIYRGAARENTLDWLANVNFSKVKSLKIFNHPKTWAFLLKFPALEELKMEAKAEPDYELYYEYNSFHQTIEGYFDSSDILELSFAKEEMYVSNIWKMLPFLKRIEVGGWEENLVQITRSQCLSFRRKLADVMRKVGHVDTSIDGPVKKVVQSIDTTLVVEGNVDGDVIQEGNGRILVNGHVEGNIEQHGNGKIFIRGNHWGELTQIGNGSVVSNWGRMK